MHLLKNITKTRARRLVLVIVGTLTVIGISSLFEPTNSQICRPGGIAVRFLYEGWRILDASSVFLTAVATVGLVIVTYLLVKLARDQAATSKAQLRAYVHVATAKVFNLDKGSGRFIQVETKNFGQTPARNERFWCAEHVREWPLRTCLNEPPSGLPTGMETVGPGRSSIMKIPVDELSENEERALRDWEAAVYFWGQITYEDVFGNKHFTNVRLVCEGEGLASGLMHATEEGNEAD
jgi:hypothetical protein